MNNNNILYMIHEYIRENLKVRVSYEEDGYINVGLYIADDWVDDVDVNIPLCISDS